MLGSGGRSVTQNPARQACARMQVQPAQERAYKPRPGQARAGMGQARRQLTRTPGSARCTPSWSAAPPLHGRGERARLLGASSRQDRRMQRRQQVCSSTIVIALKDDPLPQNRLQLTSQPNAAPVERV